MPPRRGRGQKRCQDPFLRRFLFQGRGSGKRRCPTALVSPPHVRHQHALIQERGTVRQSSGVGLPRTYMCPRQPAPRPGRKRPPATTSDEYGGLQVGKRDSTQGRKDARAQWFEETEWQSDTVRHLLFFVPFPLRLCILAPLRYENGPLPPCARRRASRPCCYHAR
jgi:hypothetical protein